MNQLFKRDLVPPIALFFKRARLRSHRNFYCINCGMPFTEGTMELTMIVDNPGSDESQPYTQTMCKRCKQKYRIHAL